MTRDEAIKKEIDLYVDACRCASASRNLADHADWPEVRDMWSRAYAHWHRKAHIHWLALCRLRGAKVRQPA